MRRVMPALLAMTLRRRYDTGASLSDGSRPDLKARDCSTGSVLERLPLQTEVMAADVVLMRVEAASGRR